MSPLAVTVPPSTATCSRSTCRSRPTKRASRSRSVTRAPSIRPRTSTSCRAPSSWGDSCVPPTCSFSVPCPPNVRTGSAGPRAWKSRLLFDVEVEGTRGREPRLAASREPGLVRLQLQARDLERLKVALERERRDLPFQLAHVAREREVGARVAQPRRLPKRQLDLEAAASRDVGGFLLHRRKRRGERRVGQGLGVDHQLERPRAFQAPTARQELRGVGRSRDAQLATVGPRGQGERRQRRAVETRLRERQRQLALGRRRAPRERELSGERSGDAARRERHERQALPGEAARLEIRGDGARRRVVAAGAGDAPAGELRLEPLELDAPAHALAVDLEHDAVLPRGSAGPLQVGVRAQRDACARLVARAGDGEGAGRGAIPLEAGEVERRSDVERVDLAREIPLVRRGQRHLARERRLSPAAAQHERSDGQASALIERLGLQADRVPVHGEVLAAQARRDLGSGRRSLDLALHTQPAREVGSLHGAAEVRHELGHGGERHLGGPAAADRAVPSQLAVGRHAGAAGLDVCVRDREAAPLDPHSRRSRRLESRTGSGLQDDLPRAASRLEVPAARSDAQRGARHSRERERRRRGCFGRKRARDHDRVEAPCPQLELGAPGAVEGHGAARLDVSAVAVDRERLHDERAALEPGAPHGTPRPDPRDRQRIRRSRERALEAIVQSVERRLDLHLAHDLGTRRDGGDERAVERSAAGETPREGQDALERARQLEARAARGEPCLRDLEGALLHREGALQCRALHAQPALRPPEVGGGDAQRQLAAPFRAPRVEAGQHEPGRALRVAQLDPAVRHLDTAEALEGQPGLRGETDGASGALRRAGVGDDHLRPDEQQLRPRAERPVDGDPLHGEPRARQLERQGRGRRVPLPERDLELSEPQFAARELRAPGLERHARRRATRRRVQEHERERDHDGERQ